MGAEYSKGIAPLLVLLMLTAMVGYAVMDNEGYFSDESDNQIVDDIHYITNSSELPDCDLDTRGHLYYVEADVAFKICSTTGWATTELARPGQDGVDGTQGPPGVNGTDGANGVTGGIGPAGADGVNGASGADGGQDTIGMGGYDGQDGVNGTDGLNALAVTSPWAVANCSINGGHKIEVGLDDNGNGSLEASEVDQTQYVCNGADGQDGLEGGLNGTNGTNGSVTPDTMLTSISTPTLQKCSSGGHIVRQGLDNGDGGGITQNGVLESGEVDYTTTYCNYFVVTRIAEINPGINSGEANDITAMGTRLYFEADDGISGHELWAHETINGSTWQVADIWSGFGSGQANDIVVMGTRLYFEADDGISGLELWAHETTNDSTWLVADICSGICNGNPSEFTPMGDQIYFQAYDGTSGIELHMMEIEHTITYN